MRSQYRSKGKIFTKIGKELAVAGKEGGSADPANNSRLRDVIAKAKESIADKLTGNIVKEIYVPGRIVNIVMK